MTDLYQNKYRISSIRLSSWDYRSNGIYFITICTKNKKHYFGSINTQDQPDLTPLGEIAYRTWEEIPAHFPFVKLGPFVIMPNHVHGIIIIHHTIKPEGNPDQISPKKGSLSSVVPSYKSACSKFIHQQYPDQEFQWQERFYERIIWDTRGYEIVCKYIHNNPKKWRQQTPFGK